MTITGKDHQQLDDLQVVPYELSSGSTARWVAGLLALLVVLVTTALWLSTRTWRYSQNGLRLLKGETQMVEMDDVQSLKLLSDQLTQVRKQNANLREQIVVLADKIEGVQGDARGARKQVQRIDDQDRERIKQLTAVNTVVKEQLVAKASAEDLKTVSSDLASVRDAIKTTDNELQMSRGEMSTLIARNHDQIEILREMGERDYFEFTIGGKNASEKMGDVTIALRGADPKKNEYNLELFVDDRRTEKRNRTINEPILFYREGERQPVEIVINQVTKNEVSGYLSVPKENQHLTIAGTN